MARRRFQKMRGFSAFFRTSPVWSEVNFKRCGTFVEENETKIPDISRHGPKIIYKDEGGTFSKGDPLVVRLAVCRRCYLRSFRSLSVVFGSRSDSFGPFRIICTRRHKIGLKFSGSRCPELSQIIPDVQNLFSSGHLAHRIFNDEMSTKH